MPIHDWKPGLAWLFHDFHHGWLSALTRTLNGGVLPVGYYALTERWNGRFDLDASSDGEADFSESPFADPFVVSVGTGDVLRPSKPYRAVTVRRERDDRLVAVCEPCRPDYHTGEVALPAVARRVADWLSDGIHVLLLNLYAAAPHQAGEAHAAVWERLGRAPVRIAEDKPLTLASYEASAEVAAYVEPVAVGGVLPDMPLFLVPGGHVLVPLEKTYLAAWEGVPARWRKVIDSGAS